MSHLSWKKWVALVAVVMFTIGAAQPESCTVSGEAEGFSPGAQQLAAGTPGGFFFITGHAPDFHALQDAGSRQLLTRALDWVRHGSALPFLWVESRITPPEGHRSGKEGLAALGLVEGRDYLHLDGAQLAAQPASWWSSLSGRFSAIAVASDKALLTQAEVDALDTHRGLLSRFMKNGGGLLALAESGTGAKLTQRDRYEFLPFEVLTSPGAAGPNSVTPFGQQTFGLSDGDVTAPAYSHFDGSSGYQAVTVSSATGDSLSLAGQVSLGDKFLYSHAGADATYRGTGTRIAVTLDGSGSSADEAGQPLRYIWILNDRVLLNTTQAISTVTLLPGVYEITLELRNKRGEVANDEVIITTVRESSPPAGPPTITCPANVVAATAPGTCGALAYFPQPVVSAPNGVASVSCSHLTGSTFPGGTTAVSCTVVDKAGLSASCGFTVTVKDEEAPTLVPPAPTTSEVDGSCHAVLPDTIAGGAQASDNCTAAGALVLTQSPPAGSQVSGVGTHVIQLRATDAAGNSTTATTTHTIIDVTPPTISSTTPSQGTLWPPNHKMVLVGVSVDASDNCGGGDSGDAVQCHVTKVTSNEPINGPGDGNTDWDWEIAGPTSVRLRAERAGPLNDRIYTIWVECADGAGYTTTGSTNVIVPHDQGNKRGR